MKELLLNTIIETQNNNELWIDNELINLLEEIPMFALELKNKFQVVNWNQACLDYYGIESKDKYTPHNYSVLKFFELKNEYYEENELSEIQTKLIAFYQNNIAGKDELPEKELNCFSVFLPRSKAKGFYREFDRFTNVKYRIIEEANILLVTILIAPITDLYAPEKVLYYLIDNIL